MQRTSIQRLWEKSWFILVELMLRFTWTLNCSQLMCEDLPWKKKRKKIKPVWRYNKTTKYNTKCYIRRKIEWGYDGEKERQGDMSEWLAGSGEGCENAVLSFWWMHVNKVVAWLNRFFFFGLCLFDHKYAQHRYTPPPFLSLLYLHISTLPLTQHNLLPWKYRSTGEPLPSCMALARIAVLLLWL